jgi:hypothetical protein
MTPDDEATTAALREALAAERASAEHLRAALRHQRAELDSLRHRTPVRAVLALDRRVGPLRRVLARAARRVRVAGGRLALAARALPRRAVAGRRGRLDRVLAGSGPPPAPRRSVATVTAAGPVVGVARAVAESAGDVVCLVAPTSTGAPGWLPRLVAAIDDGAAAAVPLLVHPLRPVTRATPHDGRVRAAGLTAGVRDGRVVVDARGAGARVTAQTVDAPPTEVAGGTAACVVVDRAAYDACGGLRPLPDLDAAVLDLCARLRAAGGRVVCVPSAVVVDARPVASPAALTRPITAAATRALVEALGPTLLRARRRRGDPLSVTISVSASSRKVAARWGDWHLAQALARALERMRVTTRVQTAQETGDDLGRCTDLHVAIRGVAPTPRTPGQPHVLWVISHPERVETAECDEADLVVVASERFAAHLRDRTATPVEVLLQATDPHRFTRLPADPRHGHPVAVVARTREVMRPIVADALAAGLRPAVYGAGWEGLVDPDLIAGAYIPNDELARVYSSVGVLLNDHWDTMRAWGFVSNRLFDALACGTPVVSDRVPEIDALFGDAVLQYDDPTDLRALVEAVLADPDAARARAEVGRERVLAAHTFDHRAHALMDVCASLGLCADPRPAPEAAPPAVPEGVARRALA